MDRDPRPLCNCCRGRSFKYDVERCLVSTAFFFFCSLAWLICLDIGVIKIPAILVAFYTIGLTGLFLVSAMSLFDGITHGDHKSSSISSNEEGTGEDRDV